MNRLRLIFAGFGNVGKEVARLLWLERRRFEMAGLEASVVAVSTRSRGAVFSPTGLKLPALLNTEWRGDAIDTADVIQKTDADVILEMTPLNVFSGQPAIAHVEAAFSTGKHVVLANKGPIAWEYDRLKATADEQHRRMLFESIVMDGAPIFSLVRNSLRGCKILGFSGVLNSTTSFVLEMMSHGAPASAAIREAQRQGFAEADPALDLDGFDAAAKVAALANVLMGARTNPLRVKRQGIGGITVDDAVRARSRGMVIRLVGRAATNEAGMVETSVLPNEIPASTLFGQTRGASSVLTLHTDLMGDISIFEHDPRITQTAFGVISDLIEIARGEVSV